MHADVLEKKGGFFGRLLQAKPDRGQRKMEFNAEDLRKLKIAGAPLMLDHDHLKKGEIGRILHQFFDEQSGWMYVWGQVHEEGQLDPKLRNDLLSGLRSSALGSLSIKYRGNESKTTGDWIPESKQVQEVSLVDVPRFEGTHLLTVNAGANSLCEVQLFPAGTIEAMSENPGEQSIQLAESALGRKLTEEERMQILSSPNPSSVVGAMLLDAAAAKLKSEKPGDAQQQQQQSAAAEPGAAAEAGPGDAGASPEELARRDMFENMAKQNAWFIDNYKKQQAPQVAKVLEALHKTKSAEEYARMEKIIQNVSGNPAQEAADVWNLIQSQYLQASSKDEEMKKLRQERNQYKTEVETYKKASEQWVGRGRNKPAEAQRDARDASPVRAKAASLGAKGSDVGAEVSVAASRRAALEQMSYADFPHSSFTPSDPHYEENMHMLSLLSGRPDIYMRRLPTDFSQRKNFLPPELR